MENSKDETGGYLFPRTSNTLYQRVMSGNADDSSRALEEFFQAYWQPMYVFMRGQGESHEDASDLVQGFIQRELLERNQIEKWQSEKGRLRTFLKVAIDRYRLNENRRQRAAIRGGGKLSSRGIDFEWAERSFASFTSPPDTPDRLFEKAWAEATMQEVMSGLAREYGEKGKGEEFQLLCRNISARAGDGNHVKYDEIAKRLGTTENNVKQKMRDFRSAFQRTLANKVGETAAPGEVEEELRYVSGLLMGKGAG